MKVQLIAYTSFDYVRVPNVDVPFEPDTDGADALAEFAGRACYQSWDRPNPATAMNEGYLANILKQRHYSVLEHASATFYVEGVSRSLTHELVRHRHLSFSQLSQRYVDASDTTFQVPPECVDDRYVQNVMAELNMYAVGAYADIVHALERKFEGQPNARKRARQAARAVLPNATETKIVVTGNHRAWREFLDKRATLAADVEIRQLAVEIFKRLSMIAPNTYQDYRLLMEETTGVTILSREGS